MKKIIKRAGIVGMACFIALLLTSSPGAAWSWETQHARGQWSNDRAPTAAQIDAYQYIMVQNGVTQYAYSTNVTGGSWMWPVDIHTGGQDGKWCIFHTHVDMYLYWGPNNPPKPTGAMLVYAQAAVELQKLVGFNWIPPAGNTSQQYLYCETAEQGTHILSGYNHVWNNTIPYGNNDLYRLYIYEVAGWIDSNNTKHPTNSPYVDYEYYRIKTP